MFEAHGGANHREDTEKDWHSVQGPEMADVWTAVYDIIANQIDIYRAFEGRDNVREH